MPFSAEHFVAPIGDVSSESLCKVDLQFFCNSKGYLGALICLVDTAKDDFKVVASQGIPIEAMNGAEKAAVRACLEDCFSRYPKAHVHNVGQLALPQIAHRLGRWTANTQRVVFAPLLLEEANYVFLGFIAPSPGNYTISQELAEHIELLLARIHLAVSESALRLRADSTQRFVREVGHDFASNVQTIIAKIHLLIENRVPQNAIKRKLAEIDQEIRAAHGLADQLGLAIDPDYQLRSRERVDLLETLDNALAQVAAEAGERKLNLKRSYAKGDFRLEGDKFALQTAWMHLLLNAIKYSFGGSTVVLEVTYDNGRAKIEVMNHGHPLPQGDERSRIWEFGYRGTKAKELHVNGSGVGLFTVRKIVLAHQGTIQASSREGGATIVLVNLPLGKLSI